MEIHIGDRVADVTLVSKEGNKVQFMNKVQAESVPMP